MSGIKVNLWEVEDYKDTEDTTILIIFTQGRLTHEDFLRISYSEVDLFDYVIINDEWSTFLDTPSSVLYYLMNK
jgi:hypothetical protein